MARIGILLTSSPFQFEHWDTAVRLADAALLRGHQVTFCLLTDGVLGGARLAAGTPRGHSPVRTLTTLLDRGARVVVCGTASERRGLRSTDYDVPRVTVGGLPDFALLVGDLDRLVSL